MEEHEQIKGFILCWHVEVVGDDLESSTCLFIAVYCSQ